MDTIRVTVLSLAMLALLTGTAGAQTLAPDEVRERVEDRLPDALELYRELLTLPNDSHHPEDVVAVLSWLEEAFEERGFRTRYLETEGVPLLLAERTHAGAERTALVYLQADGQPVDPAAWDQASPWEPVLKARAPDGTWDRLPWERLASSPDPDWRIFARSASDSKGPVAQFLSALTVAEEAGVRPEVNLKVIVDAEEELGSPHLPAAVERHREALAADMLVIFDGPPHASGEPTLSFGARGIATATLTTWGPREPQHSGHYGNYVPNPAFRMAHLLSSMKDREGRVVIPGWYEGIQLDPETREILAAVPDDETALRRTLGIAEPERVAGSLQEAIQHPSLNVRGMRAGWVGDEVRTIIPSSAMAELDIRLVPESDPERLVRLLRDHIADQGFLVLDREPTEEERLSHPRIATLTSTVLYAAFRTDFDSEPGRWLTSALEHMDGETPIRIRTMGGSIPISPFVETLGVPAVSVPTVNPDNNQHSPNENLRLGDFIRGIGVMVTILDHPLPEG